jgi:hypothetical protein
LETFGGAFLSSDNLDLCLPAETTKDYLFSMADHFSAFRTHNEKHMSVVCLGMADEIMQSVCNQKVLGVYHFSPEY